MTTQDAQAQQPSGDTCWTGKPAVCEHCDSMNCQYVKDVDHDDGSCEVFDCRACGRRFHVELPD